MSANLLNPFPLSLPAPFDHHQFMSIRLRSLALGMNHPVKCSEYWGPIAEEILKQEGHPYESWNYDKLVQHMPEMSMQKMQWYT
jgi:hypothetical protein